MDVKVVSTDEEEVFDAVVSEYRNSFDEIDVDLVMDVSVGGVSGEVVDVVTVGNVNFFINDVAEVGAEVDAEVKSIDEFLFCSNSFGFKSSSGFKIKCGFGFDPDFAIDLMTALRLDSDFDFSSGFDFALGLAF